MRAIILLILMSMPQISFGVLHYVEIKAEFTTSAKRNTALNYFVNKTSCCARADLAWFETYDVNMATHTGYGMWIGVRLTDANRTIKDELRDKIQLMNSFISSAYIYYHRSHYDVPYGCNEETQLLWSK